MRSSGRTTDELDDAVARMTPDARAVFEEHQNADGFAEPELAEGFDALTAVEKGDVTDASQLLEEVRAEEDATARQMSRRRRRLWIGSVVFSALCTIAARQGQRTA